MKYVAFLRGINVGGHKLIKMDELAKMFSDMGLTKVKTIIASGNVVFESTETNEKKLAQNIEAHLLKTLGYEVKVLLRNENELKKMVTEKPFAQYEKTAKEKDVKFYVVFFENSGREKSQIPMQSEKDGFEVIKMSEREIYLLAGKSSNGRPTNLIPLEKSVGKYCTTRNWNTVVKIAEKEM